MRHDSVRHVGAAVGLGVLLLASPGLAQHREYYIVGRVLDPEKKPLPGVEVRLLDVSTSRSYHVTTDKKGAFKLAGLPHGVYEVTILKDGYTSRRDEWKFETPQETMQRVEVPDVVLVSEARVQEVQRLEAAESATREAADKIRSGDLDGAIGLLQDVLGKNPRDANALFFLGLGYAGKKRYPEAVEALSQVTEIAPRFPGAHFELGVCYRHLGELEKALAAYDRTLELDPASADGAYNSGLILFETNRVDEALRRFQAGLATKPDDPGLLEMAGRCYVNQAKLDAAVEHFEKARAATQDPAKVETLDELIRLARASMK